MASASNAQVCEEARVPSASVWLTVSALLVALAAGLLVLRKLPETPRQGLLAVEALSDRTEILLLGSSHVYTDVDPTRVGRPWMNLAGGMLSYELAEGVLAAHAGKLPHLRAILLEADALMVTTDSLSAYHGDNRPILDLRPDLDALHVGWTQRLALARDRLLFYDLPVSAAFRREKLDAETLQLALRPSAVETVAPGYEPHAGTAPEGLDGAARVRMHERASVASAVPRNLAALARLVQHARRLGVPVVLVRLPHHHSYVASRPPAFTEAFEQLLRTARAAADDEALPFLDYEQQPVFSDGEFFDADHLNVEGSARFSALLASQVGALLEGRDLAQVSPALREPLAP